MHRMQRPRHLLATFLVFLVLGGLGTGLVGAQAADEAAQAPWVRDFHVPLPAQGDQGNYSRVEEGVLAEARGAVDGFRRDWMTFRWFEDRMLPTPEGELTLSNRLRYVTGPDRVNGVRAPIMEAGNNTPFGHEWLLAQFDQDREEVDMRFRYTLIHPAPCMLRNGFQGQTWDVRATDILLDMPCTVPSSGSTLLPSAWSSVAVLEGSDPAIVVVRANYDAHFFEASQEMWLQDGLPYPIRVVDAWSRPLDDEPLWGRTTYTLQSYQRGVEPIATEPIRVPLPALQTRHTDVPDDAALDLPFPLHQARDVARRDETIAAWLDGHPGAYLGHAEHYPFEDRQGRRTDVWALAWSDGQDVLHKQVTQTTGPVVVEPWLLAGPMALPADAEPTYEVGNTTLDLPTSFPPPQDRPRDFPTLETLAAQWRVVTRDQTVDGVDSWGFSRACVAPCAPYLWMGHRHYALHQEETLLEEGELEVTSLRHIMFWNGTQVAGYSETRHVPGDTREPIPVQDVGLQTTVIQDARWIPLTPAQAVGVTLGAAVAALAYYLAPLAKSFGAALFSRIRDDQVLDHPLRRQAYEHIQAQPGIHHRELVRRLGIGQSAVAHHVRKLAAARLVERVEDGRYVCYFARGQVDRRLRDVAPLLRADVAQQIVARLQAAPGTTGPDLLAGLSVGQSTLQYHLKRLQDAGLVAGTRAGRRMAWALTAQGQQAASALALE